jgi:hypothetical protein
MSPRRGCTGTLTPAHDFDGGDGSASGQHVGTAGLGYAYEEIALIGRGAARGGTRSLCLGQRGAGAVDVSGSFISGLRVVTMIPLSLGLLERVLLGIVHIVELQTFKAARF